MTIRGDSLYCPLSLSLDTYWNCQANCHHCYLRRLNYVWGRDLRPLDLENFQKTITNGLKNKNPKSSLAWALSQKKTIRFGNHADPFQPAERDYRVSKEALKILRDLKWTVVIQTMFTEVLMDYLDILLEMEDRVIVQPIISPGAEADWEILERRRTTPISERFRHIKVLRNKGVKVAVNGEPFIPGYHTIDQFSDMIQRLRDAGVWNYNTYNFHFNDFVAKRLHNIGIDIEKIWEMNQDKNWRPILEELIKIAKWGGVKLGCPDFVNSGRYCDPTNTCCGIDVPNPCTYNVMTWKRRILAGEDPEAVFEDTWDGVGDRELGRRVFDGTEDKMYTLKDCGIKSKNRL